MQEARGENIFQMDQDWTIFFCILQKAYKIKNKEANFDQPCCELTKKTKLIGTCVLYLGLFICPTNWDCGQLLSGQIGQLRTIWDKLKIFS